MNLQCDNQIPNEDPIQKKMRLLRGEIAWVLRRTASLVDEARAIDRLVINLEGMILALEQDLERRNYESKVL